MESTLILVGVRIFCGHWLSVLPCVHANTFPPESWDRALCVRARCTCLVMAIPRPLWGGCVAMKPPQKKRNVYTKEWARQTDGHASKSQSKQFADCTLTKATWFAKKSETVQTRGTNAKVQTHELLEIKHKNCWKRNAEKATCRVAMIPYQPEWLCNTTYISQWSSLLSPVNPRRKC